MATETEAGEELSPRAQHRRSITVTAVAALAGLVAGVVSDTVAASATDTVGVAVVVGAVGVAFGVIRAAGVDVSEFSKKDVLYVSFMTFVLWFVSWTILLTA